MGAEANLTQAQQQVEDSYFNNLSDGLFGHSFPLIFEFSGRTTKVGSVTLLSSNQVIFDRIEVGLYFLIGNAMVKTAALVLLFSFAFSKLLTNPLNYLTEQIRQFDMDDPEASKIELDNYDENELSILQNSYNDLLTELARHKDELAQAQSEIIASNRKLDEQNLMLEQEVARKTSSLSSTMLKMERQQREMLTQQEQLKAENHRRSITEKTLIDTNKELKNSIEELNRAQERLLEAEKMAVLGELSAEVSHEINTPIGVSITSTTYLADLLTQLNNDIEEQKLTKRGMQEFTNNAGQSVALLINNLNRASELVTSYKQVAVDQTSDKIRKINLAKYIDEIIHSLHPKLKKTNHSIHVDCPDNLEVLCHAGAISQIFTNLIINSIVHGFEGINRGKISISSRLVNHEIEIIYTDNGVGVPEEKLPHLFDPFYTTKAGKGGTGLGTHIINNLVSDTLNGNVKAESPEGQGLTFTITFSDMNS